MSDSFCLYIKGNNRENMRDILLLYRKILEKIFMRNMVGIFLLFKSLRVIRIVE